AYEQIGLRRVAEALRRDVPKVARIERSALEMQYAVVFGDQMKVAAPPRNAHELGEHAIGMRNRVDDVPAHRQIETAVFDAELVHALALEREPRRKPRITRSRKVEVRIDDVDAEHTRVGKQIGEPRRRLAGPASGVENARRLRQRVAAK